MTVKAAAKKVRDNWGIAFVLACFFLATIYIGIRGPRIWVQIHDNLEDIISRTYLLKEYGGAFSHGATVPILSGLNRDYLPSEWKVFTWLFLLLPPFYAYIAAGYLKVILSIVGWYFLANSISTPPRGASCVASASPARAHKNLVVLAGFLYGILSTDPPFSIAFGSLPLLLALLCRIYRQPDWKKYLLLFLYPALSDLTYFGIFICGYLLVFILWNTVYKKRFLSHMFLAFIVLAFSYILLDYRLFMQMAFQTAPTIRVEMVVGGQPLAKALWTGFAAFFDGCEHASTLYHPFIVRVCLIYLVILNLRYLIKGQFKEMFQDTFNWLIAWAAFNALLYGLQNYKPLDDLIATVIPPLKGFQIARTLWFNAFIWTLAFTVIIIRLASAGRGTVSRVAPALMVLCAISVIFILPDTYNTIQLNIKNSLRGSSGQEVADATWEEFYSEALLSEAKEEIAYQGEWSVAFGIHPAVLYWNGISTLDGYLPFYPLEYKHSFGKLIAPLLDYSAYYNDYFNLWGARAYVFPPDFNVITSHASPSTPCDMLMDADVFREMGGRYIFSALEITNADELGLTCIGTWEDDASLYTLRVYKAITEE